MKKTLVFLGAALVALLASCQKEPAVIDELTLTSAPTEAVSKDGTDTPLEIVFKATKAWTASASAEFVSVTPKSGEAGEACKVKLNVAANGTESDRQATVTIKSEGLEPLTVTIKQNGQFHMNIEPLEFNVTKEGGEFTINVDANVEFTVTDYSDGSFPWQHAVPANGSYKITIDANTGYDMRDSYVKFKTSEIQVPVIDDETGEPTGEMEDLTIRVYFYQEGLTSISWSTVLPEEIKAGTQLSMAKASGMYLVYDGMSNLVLFNPETGEASALNIEATMGEMEIAEMFNDDAGNIIAATKASNGDPFDILVIPAGTPVDAEIEPIVLVHSYYDYGGYGIGHLQARGNVLEDGIITALIAGGPGSEDVPPVTGAYWEIKGGMATTWAPYGETEEQTCQPEYVPFTTDGTIWLTNRAAFAPCGTSAEAGFLYNGYDGTYALQYYAGGTTTTLATIGDWANGVSCITSGVWLENPVVVVNNMAWFPQWAMSSVLTVFDATTMAPITTVNILGEGLEGSYMAEPSTCVLLEQKGDALIIYSADGAQGLLQKIVIPSK